MRQYHRLARRTQQNAFAYKNISIHLNLTGNAETIALYIIKSFVGNAYHLEYNKKISHCELAFYTSEEERLIESNSQQKIKIK